MGDQPDGAAPDTGAGEDVLEAEQVQDLQAFAAEELGLSEPERPPDPPAGDEGAKPAAARPDAGTAAPEPGQEAPTEPAAPASPPPPGAAPPAPTTAGQEGAIAAPAPATDERFEVKFRGQTRMYDRDAVVTMAQQHLAHQAYQQAFEPVRQFLHQWNLVDDAGNPMILVDEQGQPLRDEEGRLRFMFAEMGKQIEAFLKAKTEGGGGNAGSDGASAVSLPAASNELITRVAEYSPEAAQVMRSLMEQNTRMGKQLETILSEREQSRQRQEQEQREEQTRQTQAAYDHVVGVFASMVQPHPELSSQEAMKAFMDYMDRPGVTVGHITKDNLEFHFPVFLAEYRKTHPDVRQATGESGSTRRATSPPAMDPDMADMLEV